MFHDSAGRRGLYLGVMADAAAGSGVSLTLDHDLDVLPDQGRHMTTAVLARHVDDLARRLWAAGIRSRERVVIYKGANFDACILTMAVSRLGAVPVALSPALGAEQVSALLGRLGRPYLITDGGKLAVLDGVPLDDLTRGVFSAAGDAPGVVALSEFAGSPPVTPVTLGVDEAALITHTSGTTGVPKLVVHTPRTMRIRLRPQLFLLTMLRKRERVAIALPFVHSRTFAALALCLVKSLPVQLVRESDPGKVSEFFLKYRPGLIEALPNMLVEWEELAEDPRRPFASVKCFSSTFDAIHPRTISRLLKSSQRRGALFFQIYGQSEVGPAVGRPYFSRSAHKADGRCVGWALPGSARARVVSRNGAKPSPQNPGFIEVRWEGVAKTYFGQQDQFDAGMHEGWRRTGDVGYRTRLGCVHLLDRAVDMIDGVDSTLRIEDVVMTRLGEVCELVVVPGPDAAPTPVVCTIGDRPLDRERWRAATAAFPQLAEPVQIPLAELPRTATLKVQRAELSRRLREQPTAR